MSAAKGIFWLSSYPKSGNTWFRIVLAQLLMKSIEPLDLNQINTGAIASARPWLDELLGFDSADLEYDELDQLRPKLYQWYGERLQEPCYHKIHDAYTFLNASTPLIPQKGCLGAIYFIRNPLDVAISFAHHSRCTIDEAIENMANPQFAFCKRQHKQHVQVRQRLLSWSNHVQSWTLEPNFDVLVMRYEDMKRTPLATFTKAIQFLQLDASQEAIAKALDNAHIEKLQQQEEVSGFNERPANVKRFFRKGIIGDWQATLSTAQIEKIIAHHGKVMQEYGYLDKNNHPLVG